MKVETNALSETIEKAASNVTLLDITDASDLENMQKLLAEIQEQLEAATDGSDEIRNQMKDILSDAIEEIGLLLKGTSKDPEKEASTLSSDIQKLQELLPALTDPSKAPAAETANTEEQAKDGNASEETPEQEAPAAELVIPEEDVPLVQDFISEANEHIESAESGVLELENNSEDLDLLNLIFRGFHTIKGMAGFLNLSEIGSLAHSAENVLDLARKGELKMTGQYSDVIFESIDVLKKMLATLNESIEANAPVPSYAGLKQLVATLESAARGELLNAEDQNDRQIDEVLEKDESDVVEPPKQQESEPQAAPTETEQQETTPKEPAAESKTETTPDTPKTQTAKSAAAEPAKTQAAPAAQKAAGKSASRNSKTEEKIRVSMSRLDKLVNVVGELVIAQLMVSEETIQNKNASNEIVRKVAHQSKIVRELQELSLSMRMVPIQGVFQKMSRLVRDLSHKANKSIRFVTEGEDTELDRNIVDKISDPLVHMLRNAVDHGIESDEDRVAAGKSKSSTVELRASHQSGCIVIEIEDDGKGLDKDKIYNKAIEKGVIDPETKLSDDEIYKLIFKPGFSTAAKVTSVSGRGVGMDVVKKNIESLRGKIDIRTELGKGTLFTIRLPLTLAIIDGQTVTVGNERYIIPINSIVYSFKAKPHKISTVRNQAEMIKAGDELVPLFRLHRLFDIQAQYENISDALVVMVQEDEKKCCLLVDELLGQQQIVIKSLGGGLGKVKGISGGAILGDGKISLILDVPGLIALAQN